MPATFLQRMQLIEKGLGNGVIVAPDLPGLLSSYPLNLPIELKDRIDDVLTVITLRSSLAKINRRFDAADLQATKEMLSRLVVELVKFVEGSDEQLRTEN